MATGLKDWNQDNVGKWLNSINLGHLCVKFETLKIDGQALMIMDDAFMSTTLRLNPAEKTAFAAALQMLRSNTIPQHISMVHPRVGSYHSHNVESTRTRSRSDINNKKGRTSLANEFPVTISNVRVPEVKVGPAAQLLDEKCRHSGWIRKQGGSHPSWKQRYMVLRLGHLYYYEKETSMRPKGYFSIQGYSVEPCPGTLKNKPWCLKLVPENPRERTYYVSTGAKHEMEKWVKEIENEIDSFQDHLYDPVAIEDDDDDEETYEPMNPEELEQPADEEDHYTRISKTSSTFPRISERPVSPKRVSNTLQPMPPPRDLGRESPSVPPRSRESLSVPGSHSTSEPEEDPYYIRLLESEPSLNPPPLPPSLAPPTSSPVDLGTFPSHVGSLPVEGSPLSQQRPPRRSTDIIHVARPDFSPECSREPEEEEEEENPYYIKLNELDDILPKHCQFGSITRDEAVRRLTMDSRGNAKFTRPGTYLIRDSTHQDIVHVLSVWTGTECKHYKMYWKDSIEEGKGYCLTQGKLFPSLPLLLEYYKQEELPRSPSITLSEPYHPLDH